ncbi:hypothetical protein TrVFT333_007918 [Trichoderma virens FT-333]|nr:hypothetical protein TrVFT333_007918 [Trichoderma virens FT-333]
MPSFEANVGRVTSSAEELMSYLFYQTHLENHLAGFEYRQRMLEHWKIPSGSSVLEIGCGQGEFTVCLADAVGRVVAVDPAPAGWGTPCAGERAGFRLASHKTITPGEKNREGSREVRMLLKAEEFENERRLVEQRRGPRIALMLNGLKDAVAASVQRLGGGGIEAVRDMDVWLAKFDVTSNAL